MERISDCRKNRSQFLTSPRRQPAIIFCGPIKEGTSLADIGLFNEDVTPEGLAQSLASGWPSASLWSETLLTTVVYDLSLVSQQP